MADFDWGNLLYLLAIILFAVFGSRRKKKPATATPYETEQERSEPGIFERLFQEESIKSEPEFVQQDNVSDWRQEEDNETPFAREVYEEKEEVQPVNHLNPVSSNEENEGFDNTSSVYSPNILHQILDEPFDLRRAVIYSEILGRRSF